MCTDARVIERGKATDCETLGELAAALNVHFSTLVDYPDPEKDDCLCNVEWDRVVGCRKATDVEGFPFPEYIIERSNVF